MSRLALVETSDALPGLLSARAWSALASTRVVLVDTRDDPFLPHLTAAELPCEPLGDDDPSTLAERAKRVVARVQELGEAAYLADARDAELVRTLAAQAAQAGVEVEEVPFSPRPKGAALLDLVTTQERLLAPGGCPWDREQTHTSLLRYAVEEVYELVDAVEAGDPAPVREELGDVLLQVVFHAEMAARAGTFDIDDVARGIGDKLVRRHPHVFGEADAADAGTVEANWEALKQAEKPERDKLFDGVPDALPALAYISKLQSRAAKAGFDWGRDADAADRVRSELAELEAAGSQEERAREVGDLLMSVVGLARRCDVDPETALRRAACRFRERVEMMAAVADKPLQELSRDEWLALWDQAKAAERLPAFAGLPLRDRSFMLLLLSP